MLNRALLDAFKHYPDRPAIIGHHGGHISFSKLDDLIERLAGKMAALGVAPNIRVHVDLHDVELKIAVWLAIWRLGGDLLAGNALDVFRKYQLAPDLVITDQDENPIDL